MSNMDPRLAAVMSSINTPLKAELMMGEITEIEDGESQAGRPQTTVTVAPIINDYPQKDRALKLYVQRPMDGDAPDAVKKFAAKGGSFLRAVDPSFPKRPEKVSKGVYRTQDGATVTGNAVDKLFTADRVLIFEGLNKLADDEDYRKGLIGTRVFFKPQKAKLNAEGRFPYSQFVSFVSNELRDGDTILTDDLVDQEMLDAYIAHALSKLEDEEG